MKKNRPKNINKAAQLVSGIGASSWFFIQKKEEDYIIERYSEYGDLECSRVFFVDDTSFDINKAYQFTYISHCKQCTILQDSKKYIFTHECN